MPIRAAEPAPEIHLNPPEDEQIFPAYQADDDGPPQETPEPEAPAAGEPAEEVDWQAEAEQEKRTAQANWARFQRAKAERDQARQQIDALQASVKEIQEYVAQQRKAEEALAADASRPDPQEDAPGAFMHDLTGQVVTQLSENLGGRLEKIEEQLGTVNTWREEQQATLRQQAGQSFANAVHQEIQAMPPKLNAHVMAWMERRRDEHLTAGAADAQDALGRAGTDLLRMAAGAVKSGKGLTEYWMEQFILPEDYLSMEGVGPGQAPATAAPAAKPAPGSPSPAVAARRRAVAKAPESVPRGRPPAGGEDPVAVLAARYMDLTDEQVQVETSRLAKVLGVTFEEADRRIEERIQQNASARHRG